MLTESQRKWLTEYIGECRHELKIMPDRIKCSCGMVFELKEADYAERHVFCSRPSFSTWADLGAVKEKIEEKGEWHQFLNYAHEVCPKEADFDNPVYGGSDIADFTAWLINPSRFFELVCRWKEAE